MKEPIITKNSSIEKYQYVLIPATNSINSNTGVVVGGDYGLYGTSTTQGVNPGAVIEGILLKRGLISIDKIKPENIDKTLVVRYGESGKRNIAGGLGGYTLEVTIIILDAKTDSVVYQCTAEGLGLTESDDIRKAIHRCLSEL